MAIAYNSAGALAASAGTTSLSTAFPATVAAGDTCIIVAASYQNITLPASFNSQAQVTDVTAAINFRLAWKFCNGTEGGTSVNVAASPSSHVAAQIFRFTGAGSSSPTYEGYSANANNNFGSGDMTTVAITSTIANTLGVLIGIANGNVTFTPASGYTERVDNGSATGTGWGFTVDTIAKAVAGTTAAGLITASGIPSGYVVFGFALKPDDGVVFNAGYTPEVPRLLRRHRMIGY